MRTDNPRTAVERLRQKAKGDLSIRRMVDCGDYYLVENGAKNAPAAYRIMKRNGAVKKSRKKNPVSRKQQAAKAAARGLLKALLRKVTEQ